MSDDSATIEMTRPVFAGGGIRSVRRRFVLAIALLMAVVLIAISVVLALYSRSYLRREIEQHARSFAELAVRPVCDAYQTYFESGLSKFREILLQIFELNPDLASLAIYDTEGTLLFRSDQLDNFARDGDEIDLEIHDVPRLRQAVRGLEMDAWRESGREGERFLVVEPYIEEWGRHRYSAVFFISYRGLAEALASAAWRIAALAGLALALGVGCAFLLAAQSLVPVAKLTVGARRLAEGDLQHRIGLRTGDEFEVLAETLDLMAEHLDSTIADLEGSNERLERLNEELQQLDRMKSDLLANVSHELRTPLTAISGYVEAMQSGLLGGIDETQRDSLFVVERNIRRLRDMIDQLLSYSLVESGRLEVELRAFALEPVLEHVVEGIRAIHGSQLDLEFDRPVTLPEVYGDASRIAQVVENLLTNAIKFSPAGAPILLRARKISEGVEIEVSDHGIGIPEDQQTQIFERFYQIDTGSQRRFGGMGLGLAIVREILELHHSEIHVDSRSAKGATFRFALPIAADRTGARPAQGMGPKIALIDDDAVFVQKVAAHLSSRGFVVETAATVEQGLALVRRARPDVVLLDRLLSDGDGFDLLAQLQQNRDLRSIPTLLISVRRQKALGLRLGAAGYLVKPVEPAQIEEMVLKVLTK